MEPTPQEFALTPSSVNTTTFGKLFSCAVDGNVYTQPLWVPQLTISGSKHNVVFVGTAARQRLRFRRRCQPLLNPLAFRSVERRSWRDFG